MRPTGRSWLIGAGIIATAFGAQAATLTVDAGGAGGAFTAIQAAIDAAAPGDEVLVLPGQYVIDEPLTFRGKALTVRSRDGAAATTVRMGASPADERPASVVAFAAADGESAVLEGFTLTGGGGSECNLQVLNSGLIGRCGGAVLASGSAAKVRKCTITGNRADVGGGVCAMNGATLTVTDCLISGNEAHEGGGLAGLDAAPVVSACTFTGNTSRNTGRADWLLDGDGGGIFLRGVGADPNPKTASVTACSFSDNHSDDNGGGIFVAYSIGLTLADCTVSHGTARNGGGLYVSENGNAVVSRCTFEANQARAEGGGLHCDYAGCTLADCTVVGNESAEYGGGGYFDYAVMSCEHSTFAHNASGLDGGGVLLASSPQQPFRNCVFLENSAGEDGGAIALWGASAGFDHCTLAGNAASNRGGGIFSYYSQIFLYDSIVWGNAGRSYYTEDAWYGGEAVRSCIENPFPWPGAGCISVDPRFCGWRGVGEVFVDAAAPAPGDGSAAHPFTTLAPALQYDYALAAAQSPCIGTAFEGTNMGADTGVHACAEAPVSARTIRVAGGTYSLSGLVLANHVSIIGTSATPGTVLEGTAVGLRTGARFEAATVTGGSGIRVGAGEAPEVIHATMRANEARYGGGFFCGAGAAPVVTDCTIEGNVALESGGGCFFGAQSAPKLLQVRIRGNGTTDPYLGEYGGGGGVFCAGQCAAEVVDSLIVENWSPGGGGVCCVAEAVPTFMRCTISGNGATGMGGGVSCSDSAPKLSQCIVWENMGAAIGKDMESSPFVTGSCIEGGYAGEGNVAVDPRFCGWGGRAEVHVNAANPVFGDGTSGNPYRELAPALEFNYALAADSPCLGMGMALDPCVAQGGGGRAIYCAPGTYEVGGLSLVHGAAVRGAGRETTILHGTVYGLKALLQSVTVTGGLAGGIVVPQGAHAQIVDCAVTRNLGSGIVCLAASTALINHCEVSLNEAESGGGIVADDAAVQIVDCRIAENGADWGGGVYCRGARPTVIRASTISANTSWTGAAVYAVGAPVSLEACTVIGNRSMGDGVLMAYRNPNDASLTLSALNCVIAGNAPSGFTSGGSAVATFVNTTFARNAVDEIGCSPGSRATFTNCLFAGAVAENEAVTLKNSVAGRDPLFAADGVFDFARFKSFEIGGVPVVRPDFVVTAPDLHLRRYSPALNIGTSEGAPSTDIEGVARPCYGAVDAGAYELCGLGPNEPPTLTVAPEQAALYVCGPPVTQLFTANAADPEAAELRYEWTVTPTAAVTAAGAQAEVAFATRGDYTVTCTVRDGIYPVSVTASVHVDSCETVAVHIGDVNGDKTVDIADAVRTLTYLFAQGGTPPCLAAADGNHDAVVNIADAVAVLGYLFAARPLKDPDGMSIAPGNAACNEYPAGSVTLECTTPCTP